MTQVDNLTNAADQTSTLVLPDNTAVTMRLRYRPRTKVWTADFAYAPSGLDVRGMTLTCMPNVLRPWRNLIPFGVAFMTADFTMPFDLEDFASGRVKCYLLNAADVALVESQVIGRPS